MTDTWPVWMYDTTPYPRMVSVSLVNKAVSKIFGTPVREILSNSRLGKIVTARQAGYALSRTLTNKSMPQIGAYYNRDHTTVLDGLKKNRHKIDNDAELVANLKEDKHEALVFAGKADAAY